MRFHSDLELDESASLHSMGNGRTFESKYLLEDEQALRLENWALSSHLNALEQNTCLTNLYFDSECLGIFKREKGFRKHKFRVRRVGQEDEVILERKTKQGERVKKQQTTLPLGELSFLEEGRANTDWPGYWFHRQLNARQLGPVFRFSYQRTTYVGETPWGPMLFKLDRHLKGEPTKEWNLDPVEDGRSALPNRVILELEYCGALPATFKRLLQEFRLTPISLSKYRRCWQAWNSESTREVGLDD